MATPALNQGVLKHYPIASTVDPKALLNARSALFARCGKFIAGSDDDTPGAALAAFFARTESEYAKDLKGADALSGPPGNALYTGPVQKSSSAPGGSYSTHTTCINSPHTTSFRKPAFILNV